MRDIQSHSITWLSRNDLESECLSQVAKTRKYSIFGTNNFPKIRAYAVLNTLSRTVTLKFLDENTAKLFTKKVMLKITTYKGPR